MVLHAFRVQTGSGPPSPPLAQGKRSIVSSFPLIDWPLWFGALIGALTSICAASEEVFGCMQLQVARIRSDAMRLRHFALGVSMRAGNFNG